MSRSKRLAFRGIAILCVALPSAPVLAFNDSLSFRINPNGDVEAIVSGLTDGCQGFTGPLYSTTGTVFFWTPWPSISVAQAGSMSLRFIDGESVTLSYTVNGIPVTKAIQREVFGSVLPRCQ